MSTRSEARDAVLSLHRRMTAALDAARDTALDELMLREAESMARRDGWSRALISAVSDLTPSALSASDREALANIRQVAAEILETIR